MKPVSATFRSVLRVGFMFMSLVLFVFIVVFRVSSQLLCVLDCSLLLAVVVLRRTRSPREALLDNHDKRY